MDQSTKDALADAETLRKFSRSPIHRAQWGGYLDYCANQAKNQLTAGGYPESWARAAAHAALCAVPGLRGDK